MAAADAPPAPYAPATGPARMQTASGLDVSQLPRPLQRAATREADRAQVVTWLQRYSHAPEPEGGWIGELVNQGDTNLAVAIEADAAAAALDARHRLMAESEKAQTAWRVSPDNPAVQADMAARRRSESVKAAEAIDRQSHWNRT